ncbi:MAG: hypothetical protein J7K30_06680 [Deltaproteobacteria bacterium]|uniref:hypothetical protein n=1 Tax=Desulfosarcina sp. BuS5 TaxID=933262 RepID=UPI000482E375|nr:hypothetical protein [Desulfosarcina sp. BuS5]MCD6272522.1 hypothetical protein [Deltaproteobacteria bacterium]WDN89643.1 hypothetical protein BuS5_02611 [Desulfosarcina sp. BuS5]
MDERKTVACADVLKEDFYCECGTWVYCPDMNGTKLDDQQNEVPVIGEGCTKHDKDGEYMECPECGVHYYLV